jgi:hypothetical protein
VNTSRELHLELWDLWEPSKSHTNAIIQWDEQSTLPSYKH